LSMQRPLSHFIW